MLFQSHVEQVIERRNLKSALNLQMLSDSEEIFLQHLREFHLSELKDISKKENIPIETVEMITISNSKVFINS